MSVRRTALFASSLVAFAAVGCEKPSPAPQKASAPAPETVNPAPAQPAAPRSLPEGLIITDSALGDGPECPSGASVTVNFTAKLADGSVYDSTDKRKRSWTIPLSNPNVIAGLREGIPGMRVGGKRTIIIPWKLAYGEQGRDPIPPKNDLTFEIELLKWEPGTPVESPSED